MQVVSTEEACLLLGVRQDVLLELIQTHQLEKADPPEQDCREFVSKDSLQRLLRQHLYGEVAFEDWYRWTVTEHAPLLTAAEAGEYIGLTREKVVAHILAGELVALQVFADYWRIPLPVVNMLKAQLERTKPRTVAQLVRLFSIKYDVALRLRQTLCSRHVTLVRCPNYWCVERFVAENLAVPGRSAAEWLEARERVPEVLVPLSSFAEVSWAVTPKVITEALDRGILNGIWIPQPRSDARDLMVTQTSASAFIHWRDHEYSLVAQQSRR